MTCSIRLSKYLLEIGSSMVYVVMSLVFEIAIILKILLQLIYTNLPI